MITPTNLAFAKVATAEPAQWHKSTVSVSARMNTKFIFDAEQLPGASNDDTIGTARDLSGYGNDLVQSTAGHKPLYKSGVQNGKPGIYFDGTDDYLQCLTLSMTQPCTYFVVFDTDDAGVDGIFDGTAIGDRNYFYGDPSGHLYITAPTAVGGVYSHPTSTVVIAKCVFNTTSSLLTINNSAAGSGDVGANNLSSGINIGVNYAIGSFMQGYILELIAIDSLLESSEATYYEDRLSNKYNIALS